MAPPVELGFVDECSSEFLHAAMFPSKVGGNPAWLAMPPPTRCLSCKLCTVKKSGNEKLRFLMQVYTGGTWSSPDTFHRTLFVFCCGSPGCYTGQDGSAKHIRVMRSQLPRQNKVFSSDPPDEDNPSDAIAAYDATHGDITDSSDHLSAYTFPELEIIMDEERLEGKTPPVSEECRPAVDVAALEAPTADDDEFLTTFQSLSRNNTVDRSFAHFKERIAGEPSQVLRYQKGGEPLWIGPTVPHDGGVAPCELCGAPRRFEMQIMPQLLQHLEVEPDSDTGDAAATIDWGVLGIFTCENSCSIGDSYVEEFVFSNSVSTDVAEDDDSDSDDDGVDRSEQ